MAESIPALIVDHDPHFLEAVDAPLERAEVSSVGCKRR
jgi:hypothetical protein